MGAQVRLSCGHPSQIPPLHSLLPHLPQRPGSDGGTLGLCFLLVLKAELLRLGGLSWLSWTRCSVELGFAELRKLETWSFAELRKLETWRLS